MRIGLLGDLHLGSAAPAVWHNRQMHAHAQDIVRAAVALLNRQGLDRVIVLGDVTQSGLDDELAAASALLSELTTPWWIIPGNHDDAAVASGAFDRTFVGHVPAPLKSLGDAGVLFVREHPSSAGSPLVSLVDWPRVRPRLEDLARRGAPLLLCTHRPVLSAAAHAQRHAARYAGHIDDGAELVRRLRDFHSGPLVLLSAHQHWHHVMHEPRGEALAPKGDETAASAVQIATASLIEYPMECRVLTLNPGSLHAAVLPSATPDLALQSLLEGARWVSGDAEARDVTIAFN